MNTVSPLDHGAQIDLNGHPLAACFRGDTALMVHADGEIVRLSRHGEEGRTRLCDGGILYAKPQENKSQDGALICVDERGRVYRSTMETNEELAHIQHWPSALACGAEGSIAVAYGRKWVFLRPKQPQHVFEAPSMISGLAFAPKGVRVFAAHKDGVSAWYAGQPAAAPLLLSWKGAHLDVTLSPDGAFVVSTMQENALHGWRLADSQHMRMSGYPAKTRSVSWDHKGKWLATSGADCAILWPFHTKNGPIGQQPRELAIRADVQVTQVAFHPKAEVLAVGYSDGMVLLSRLSDMAEILAVRPTKASICLLHWSADGRLLAWGTSAGIAGVFPAAQ